MQRRFTIRTNPPGAVVYVDDYEIGTTPVSHDFVYYGTRKIRVVKDGYETLTVMQRFPTPWYQIIGIDFITENLIPGEIRDERVVDYQLQPQVIVPTEQLLGRAENLRRGSQPPTGVVPAGAIMPAVAPVVSPTGVLPPPLNTYPVNPYPPANAAPPQGYSLPPQGPPMQTPPANPISPYTGQPSYGPQTFGPPATPNQPGTFAPQQGMQPPPSQPPTNQAPGYGTAPPNYNAAPPSYGTTPPAYGTVPPGGYNPPMTTPPAYNTPPPQNNPPLYPPPNY